MFHVLRAYCIFESNQASTITLSGPRLNNKAPFGIIIINSKPLLLVNQSVFTVAVYYTQ